MNGWHLKPATMITLILLIFAVGGWTYLQEYKTAEIANKTNTLFKLYNLHSKDHVVGREKLIQLETHMLYVRDDIAEIKEIVKENARNIRQIKR